VSETASRAAALRERQKELGRLFLQRTLQEIPVLRESLSRTRAGDLTAFGEMERLAHRMSGTGATLGFPAISEAAARVERIAGTSNPSKVDALAAAIDFLDGCTRQTG
jgi:HPt (histidine-containing phosphotransfer) domain-containing protein